MQIFLIRHGESANNALGDVSRRVKDPELTEKGRKQADQVADFIAAGGHLPPAERGDGRPVLDRLYCSAMIRALHTATPIGRALKVQPQVWVDIHEVGGIFLDGPQGAVGYPGEGRGAIADRFPDCVLPDEVQEEGWWKGERESENEGFRRAGQVVEQLWAMCRDGGPGRVGLVSHGGTMDNMIKAFLGLQDDTTAHFGHYNTAITRLTLTPGGGLSLLYTNRHDHLGPELVTGPG